MAAARGREPLQDSGSEEAPEQQLRRGASRVLGGGGGLLARELPLVDEPHGGAEAAGLRGEAGRAMKGCLLFPAPE